VGNDGILDAIIDPARHHPAIQKIVLDPIRAKAHDARGPRSFGSFQGLSAALDRRVIDVDALFGQLGGELDPPGD